MTLNNKKTILLIDGLNEFRRNFAANPTQSTSTGEQIGGVVGFLKSLSYLISKIHPHMAIIIFDGKNAAEKRKKIVPSYKGNRNKVPKLNRFYNREDECPDDINENMKFQLCLLLKYLSWLPFYVICIETCEADDIIAHLCLNKFKDDRKIIVSNDKDFFQLLDDKTIVYRTIKKEFVTTQYTIANFGVYPCNFALLRALGGDTSDNIKGVARMGYKNSLKFFPALTGEQIVEIEQLQRLAEAGLSAKKKPDKSLQTFLESIDTLRANYKAIRLDGSMVGLKQLQQLDYAFTKPIGCDKISILKGFAEDGISGFSYNWSDNFSHLLLHTSA